MGVYDSSNGKYTPPFSEKLGVDAFKKPGNGPIWEVLSPLQSAR
jgi:hypothetical protein